MCRDLDGGVPDSWVIGGERITVVMSVIADLHDMRPVADDDSLEPEGSRIDPWLFSKFSQPFEVANARDMSADRVQ